VSTSELAARLGESSAGMSFQDFSPAAAGASAPPLDDIAANLRLDFDLGAAAHEEEGEPGGGGGRRRRCCLDLCDFDFRGNAPLIGLVALGVAALGCLIAALAVSPPQPMAAGGAAALGWLACYAYMLQQECRHLAKLEFGTFSAGFCDDGGTLAGRASAKKDVATTAAPQRPPLPPAAPSDRGDGAACVDLDLTGYAGSLGLLADGGLLGPCTTQWSKNRSGSGGSGHTMQAVLTSALVNEYLRCAGILRAYQTRYGRLSGAPACDLGFAETLVAGLRPGGRGGATGRSSSGGVGRGGMVSPVPILAGLPAAAAANSAAINAGAAAAGGRFVTPRQLQQEPPLSPAPVRTSPSTSQRRQGPSPRRASATSVLVDDVRPASSAAATTATAGGAGGGPAAGCGAGTPAVAATAATSGGAGGAPAAGSGAGTPAAAATSASPRRPPQPAAPTSCSSIVDGDSAVGAPVATDPLGMSRRSLSSNRDSTGGNSVSALAPSTLGPAVASPVAPEDSAASVLPEDAALVATASTESAEAHSDGGGVENVDDTTNDPPWLRQIRHG